MAPEPEGSSPHSWGEPGESTPRPPTNLPKVHFEPILPSMPWSVKWSFSFGLSHQNPLHLSPLSHACHMPRPPLSPWFDLLNNVWRWVQIMKLPIMMQVYKLYLLRQIIKRFQRVRKLLFSICSKGKLMPVWAVVPFIIIIISASNFTYFVYLYILAFMTAWFSTAFLHIKPDIGFDWFNDDIIAYCIS
jgi:hypothetical protein